jgi:hypothetical protein
LSDRWEDLLYVDGMTLPPGALNCFGKDNLWIDQAFCGIRVTGQTDGVSGTAIPEGRGDRVGVGVYPGLGLMTRGNRYTSNRREFAE